MYASIGLTAALCLAALAGCTLAPRSDVAPQPPAAEGRLVLMGTTDLHGWIDEMARRMDERPLPAGYTIVSSSPYGRIAIDTTVTGPRGGEGVRGRFRIEYRQPITPSAGGVAQEPIDAVEYEMDFDCGDGRTRLVARATYLEGRRLSSNRPERQAWAVPQPDGHYARGRDAVCRTIRHRT